MHYAAFLQLQGKLCVVVGGGAVATRKVRNLLTSGASITVVSPEIGPQLQNWIADGRVRHLTRKYQTTDVDGAALVFAATNDRAVNERIANDAEERGIWCNVADDATACDFIVPAVYEQAGIQLAISTSGRSPALAKQLRDALAKDLEDGGRRFYAALEQLSARGGTAQ
ncbi:precorrin-2 dehydrogenase/sirohydrochlorin ferrochelatase family protein [Alicyclobacillus fastidiosus]|uniref:precorrin-2 dehydrogenase n=1 Tax=Alicyclobacillus fastidiosus TaxID=392011 RepID=A0ABV5ACV7_9BACL|nr:bifunctional precorrin-2 dehydrogenase/sirohydrochlorin ferrochelatase [Alicyclobacillus fastidiosus]WEH10358.1 bifunctional precorrin-2 dehydrogenase/sirohydrochlorin ferrochelatase [Alicyclobacillus fastidiosus]